MDLQVRGDYEVEISNGEELAIKIKDDGYGNLIAIVEEVLNYKTGFNVNDEIFINKSDIGGTTGYLKIIVSELRSIEYIYEKQQYQIQYDLYNIKDRQRRRQNIP